MLTRGLAKLVKMYRFSISARRLLRSRHRERLCGNLLRGRRSVRASYPPRHPPALIYTCCFYLLGGLSLSHSSREQIDTTATLGRPELRRCSPPGAKRSRDLQPRAAASQSARLLISHCPLGNLDGRPLVVGCSLHSS